MDKFIELCPKCEQPFRFILPDKINTYMHTYEKYSCKSKKNPIKLKIKKTTPKTRKVKDV